MVVEDQSKSRSATGAMRILLVEDEADARDAIREFLRALGHDVVAADSAAEALRSAAETRPDVAICDWQLGDGSDGADVARKLQQAYGTRIIFITAHQLSALREATHDLDIDLYLRKPISLQALSRAINTR